MNQPIRCIVPISDVEICTPLEKNELSTNVNEEDLNHEQGTQHHVN